jgi:hypothetical protein
MAAFLRERLAAARWLETFACRSFVPPPPEASFGPYERDPARSGVCQHCHQTIDPAAIFFKRFDFSDARPTIANGDRWMSLGCNSRSPYGFCNRVNGTYLPDTVLTPATEAQMAANPDARFIDFLPPDQALFGRASDGTVGPLGFGRLLVESGEFDRCAVRRIYARFGGRLPDAGRDRGLIEELVRRFVAGGRRVRPLVRSILADEAFQRGF